MTELRFDEQVVVVTGAGAVSVAATRCCLPGAAHGIGVNAIAPRVHTRMSADKPTTWRHECHCRIMQFSAMMAPVQCAPAAAFLAHRSCSLNGEVLQVRLGGVARIAVVQSQGIWKEHVTIEDIVESLVSISDIDGANAMAVISDL